MKANIFWGTILVLVGAVLLLSSAGVLPPPLSRLATILLPLLVVAFGIYLLVRSLRRHRGPVAGVVVLLVGLFWLGEQLGWASDRLFLPVLLIALGLGLVLRSFLARLP